MNSIGTMGMNGMLNPRDLFSKVDSDGNGGVSPTELQKLSDVMKKRNGRNLDASGAAFINYDSDGSGSLSGEELKAVLDNSGFGPANVPPGEASLPPPPQQAADSYAALMSDSEQETITSLVSNLTTLLEKLSAVFDGAARGNLPPEDIFGKVDTDRSGSLSRDELNTLAGILKTMTGQTLDVSDEAVAGYDSNGDGELTPDELDLRKVLSLNQSEGSGETTSKELMALLDQNWFQQQSASGRQVAQNDSSSMQDQMKELKSLLKAVSRFSEPNTDGAQDTFSVMT